MAAFKSLKSLVQLQHQQGTLFKVVGDSSKLPKWFHTEHLDDPETVYVDAWLVEKMFGKDGEYILHVECVTRTLLQVNQWNPEEEAEILIFGPPDYQKDVSQMIWNLVDYFCKQVIQEEDCSQETETQCLPLAVREADTQPALVEVHDAATLLAPVENDEAATHLAPMEDPEAATQLSLVENAEAATQLAPVENAEAANQLAQVEDGDATMLAPVEDSDDAQLAPEEDTDTTTQLGPVAVHEEASEVATVHTSGEVHQDVIKQCPIEVCEAATIPSSTL